MGMCHRVLLGLVVGIAACASAPEGSLPDHGSQGMNDEAARAIGLSRTANLADPVKYRSVWGSPLQLDRAEAREATWIDGTHRVDWVRVPEASPRGLPSGLELQVELATGECRPMEME